jgi:hypothetical protein
VNHAPLRWEPQTRLILPVSWHQAECRHPETPCRERSEAVRGACRLVATFWFTVILAVGGFILVRPWLSTGSTGGTLPGGYAGYNRAALALVGLSGAEPRKNKSPGSEGKPGLLSVVAGRGFEPLTFRL